MEETKPAAPELPAKMEESDLLRLQLAIEITARHDVALQLSRNNENALRAALKAKYALGDTDVINFATALITRA